MTASARAALTGHPNPYVLCDACGQSMPATVFGMNDHIRQCPEQNPRRIAELILDRGDYLDGHAEIVARAYLEKIE